jgi:transposase-like protein
MINDQLKGRHHQQDIILPCVRWYMAYSLSYRDLEELMQERGYAEDHCSVQRWVIHYTPRIVLPDPGNQGLPAADHPGLSFHLLTC